MAIAAATDPARNISRLPDSGLRSLSEADLVRLWEGQRFPPEALRTMQGEPLRVIYRGRRNGGPGPDFRDAIISAPLKLLSGDIELHVRSSDFRRHGHHRDPAYDGLALHLVFRHDDDVDTRLASGRRIPVAALGNWVEDRAREIRGWLERPEAWQEPCRSAVTRLGPEVAGTALDRLGMIRFRAKTAACSIRVRDAGPDQALWEGILEALGYGGSRELMRDIAAGRPWKAVAGLVNDVPAKRWAVVARAALLGTLDGLRERHRVGAGRTALRPKNRPEARLRGAAVLAGRFASGGPWEALRPLVSKGEVKPLLGKLTVAGSIGPGRALEMAANAVLPCAAAAGMQGEAEAIYARLRMPARYGAVGHIHSALGTAVPVDTRRQQGMLYLLREYCARGGCGRCPLS